MMLLCIELFDGKVCPQIGQKWHMNFIDAWKSGTINKFTVNLLIYNTLKFLLRTGLLMIML